MIFRKRVDPNQLRAVCLPPARKGAYWKTRRGRFAVWRTTSTCAPPTQWCRTGSSSDPRAPDARPFPSPIVEVPPGRTSRPMMPRHAPLQVPDSAAGAALAVGTRIAVVGETTARGEGGVRRGPVVRVSTVSFVSCSCREGSSRRSPFSLRC